MKKRLILGTSSESRIKLISKLGIVPEMIISPNIDESRLKNEKPLDLSKRLASAKLDEVIKKINENKSTNTSEFVVLTADTVTCVGRRVLDKTNTKEDAVKCLEFLSGRNHDVYTSISIANGDGSKKIVKYTRTVIKLKNLTPQEIDFIVNNDNCIGKSGGCNIEGLLESFVININGSHSNIIGLPMYQVRNCLLTYGVL
jgi:septum formation protein